MAVEPKVIDRIRKLLALAGNNPNEHEAALAASRAQELMLEHDLTMASVSTKMDARTTGIERTERKVLRQKGKPGGWKVALFNCVGSTSDCWVYASEGSKYYDATGYLIGRSSDVEMAHYLFDFLVAEMERLQQEFGKTRWAELREYAKHHGISTHDAERDFSSMGRHPLKAKDSWIKGAAETVISTLHSEHYNRRNRNEATSALAINKEAAIRDWWAQQRGYADYAAYTEATKSAGSMTIDKRTPAQKRRDAERDEKAWKRQSAKEARERARRMANLDVEAYSAGREAGKSIAVRRGVKGGATAPAQDLIS